MTYKVGITEDKSTVFLAVHSDSLPANAIEVGTFEHDHADDVIHSHAGNHALVTHIRELLYHVSAADPSETGFHPDNITDMSRIKIEYTGPALTSKYVEVTPGVIELEPEDTETLVLKYVATNGTKTTADNEHFTFTSLDEAVATVSSEGVVTAVAEGSTEIQVIHKDMGKPFTVEVIVA